MTKDIFRRNNLIMGLMILICCTFLSCSEHSVTKSDILDYASKESLTEEVRHQIYDSLSSWKENRLNDYIFYNPAKEKLDTLIAFNSEKNKLIAVLHNSIIGENPHDGGHYLYGVKIKEGWYFFGGPYMILPRKNKSARQSFAELSDLAYKNIFRHYLKRNWKGELEINEDFFESMENKNKNAGGYGPCYECKSFEEYVMFLVRDNWSRVDTTDYSRK